MLKGGWVYIVSNHTRTVLYIGVTSDIVGRMWEHQQGSFENSFSRRYNTKHLLYYERYESIEDAITREKQLKRHARERKLSLIKNTNPALIDLYTDEFIQDNS